MATKTSTLAPPTDFGPTAGLLSVTITEDPADATRVRIEIWARAKDPVTGVEEGGAVVTGAAKGNANVQAIGALALAAWKTAKGY